MRIDSSVVEPFDFAAVGARQPTSRARVLEVRIQSPPPVSLANFRSRQKAPLVRGLSAGGDWIRTSSRGRVNLVVGRRRQRNRTARRSRCRCASVTFDRLVPRTKGREGKDIVVLDRWVEDRTEGAVSSLAIAPGIGIMKVPARIPL